MTATTTRWSGGSGGQFMVSTMGGGSGGGLGGHEGHACWCCPTDRPPAFAGPTGILLGGVRRVQGRVMVRLILTGMQLLAGGDEPRYAIKATAPGRMATEGATEAAGMRWPHGGGVQRCATGHSMVVAAAIRLSSAAELPLHGGTLLPRVRLQL